MKIAAVTVWFNPSEKEKLKFLNNAKTYEEYVEKIFVVDNSKYDNSEIVKNLDKYIYIYNGNKNGIAGALNAGCRKAVENNFDWVLTMDQDSFFQEEQINNFIIKSKEIIANNPQIASIAPAIKNSTSEEDLSLETCLKSIIKNQLKKIGLNNQKKTITYPQQTLFDYKERVITSGNLINLDIWKKVEGFYELLFIDNVDFDFCYKLTRNNYKIIMFNNIFMNHNLGISQDKISLFKRKTPLENDFRLYYIIRNLLIDNYRFPEYKQYHTELIKKFLFDYLINTIPPFYKVITVFKAYKDYKKLKKNNLIKQYQVKQ